MVRADSEALFYLQRMAEFQPDAMNPPAKEKAKGQDRPERFPESKTLLEQLLRRQKDGTFANGGEGPKPPADFAAWPVQRRITYLIQQLQEVDARQSGQPGGIDLASDPRVAALIEIGDPAVPALIDCIEKDQRLTRSVHFWRDFASSRTVLGVREAALSAVMSILRTTIFESAATGDNFTSRGEDQAKQTAQRLRAYWKIYGKLPFDQRMMSLLTDPKAKPQAWREAAENLANLGEKKSISTTVFSGRIEQREPGTPNPAITNFKNPTVAQAILAAMDRDLAQYDAAKRDPNLYEYRRRQIDGQYMDALIHLKDPSIIPALQKRLESPPDTRTRRMLAVACMAMGDAGPLTAFAVDVRDGRITVSSVTQPNRNENEQPGIEQLSEIVHTLIQASPALPQAKAALWALGDPAHPLYPFAKRAVHLAARHPAFDGRPWLYHPYFLRILSPDLNDATSTGTTYAIEHEDGFDRLAEKDNKGGSGSRPVPQMLTDPAARRQTAQERVCDQIAQSISSMIAGVRPCHALFKDEDQRIAELKSFLSLHLTHLRPMTYLESDALGKSAFDPTFVLNIRALAAGATARDVKGNCLPPPPHLCQRLT
jgi:hypothetical protein